MSYTAFDRFVARQRFRAAIPHIRVRSRVCDVGCGIDAKFLHYAKSRIQFGVGLDYQAIAGCSSGSMALVRCDMTDGVPLRGEQFDHVVMLAVFEHLERPCDILIDVHRVLLPGGSLIMTWPQAVVDPILNLLHRIGFVSSEMESDQHQSRLPLQAVLAMLKKIGFANFTHRRFEFGLNNLLVAEKTR